MLRFLRDGVVLGLAAAALAVGATGVTLTHAQAPAGEPIKIGFAMALTGPLAANGKQALLGAKIWEEETNKKGGLLGRPVKIVFYDDQSNPSTVPGIYTKLLDVDKVDLVVGPYATAMIAPAMPVIIQKGKVFIGLFGLAVNSEFNYPKYFAMIPSGPNTKPAFTEGFFQVAAAQNPKPQTVAIVAADLEFSHNAAQGARENAQKYGFKVVYDKSYPPSTTDFSPIVRAIAATNPDVVVVCSYPLGYYLGTWGYAYLELLGNAVSATKSLKDDDVANYLRSNTIKTIMGDIKFGPKGECAQSRMLQVQYHSIKGNAVDQFKGMDTQTVLTPTDLKTGNVIYPYEKAK